VSALLSEMLAAILSQALSTKLPLFVERLPKRKPDAIWNIRPSNHVVFISTRRGSSAVAID
jgi:hypothetical protein